MCTRLFQTVHKVKKQGVYWHVRIETAIDTTTSKLTETPSSHHIETMSLVLMSIHVQSSPPGTIIVEQL